MVWHNGKLKLTMLQHNIFQKTCNHSKQNGAYYVPAVEADYIKNMPVYGGNYN